MELPQQSPPRKKDWKEIAKDEQEMLLFLEQSMDIHRAILTEAESHIKK